ncbi:chromosome segregation protein SMC [Synechococcus sp. M16CYN]|uniref:chromosome segregation protein SMC n=1 Tax=Synechococcus sp. M16CYN TaxID=3103139 RepID=UPI003249462A
MVHIKQVGLTRFKSFGDAVSIPLKAGFTVVTGPNGSGKSNILDGIMFCLGLASSRGMRANCLPDLINSSIFKTGEAGETSVSVRFDLSGWRPDAAEKGLENVEKGPWIQPGQREWTVTRKLRVMPGGSYSSSYSADGVPCNLRQLQTQLRRLHIDPEGSNIVVQGDVTRIVSMSNHDRRGIIDELAGVALFDTRIEQTRRKLDDVQDRQARCKIAEQELLTIYQRLGRDCAKASEYQKLRELLILGQEQEMVLIFETAKQALTELGIRQQGLETQKRQNEILIANGRDTLDEAIAELQSLQEQVKSLGEDQLFSLQAKLAGLEASGCELDRRATQYQKESQQLERLRNDLSGRQKTWQHQYLQYLEQDKNSHREKLAAAEKALDDSRSAVEVSRRKVTDVANRSGAWLEKQKRLSVRRQELQSDVSPKLTEKQQLQECLRQELERLQELHQEQQQDDADKQEIQKQLTTLEEAWQTLLRSLYEEKQALQQTVDSLAIQQRTRSLLEKEGTHLEREIACLESRRDVIQESRGTRALRLLLEAGLDGIHGTVAQLGEVQHRYHRALEVAAGVRLRQVVVDDDRIAAQAIELLKSRHAGRLTFLPLNKIYASARGALPYGGYIGDGFIGRAVELVQFKPIYNQVFTYVFGETLVFTDLATARQQLGRLRAVTLDGELLEKSGAMTGGSLPQSNDSFGFGFSNDQDETKPYQRRLLEIRTSLRDCWREESELAQLLEQQKSQLRKLEQHQAIINAERNAAQRNRGSLLERECQRAERLSHLQKNQTTQRRILEVIDERLRPLLDELKQLNEAEQSSRDSDDAATWQHLQHNLEAADRHLELARQERDDLLNAQHECQLRLERLKEYENVLTAEELRFQEDVQALAKARESLQEQRSELQEKLMVLKVQQQDLQEHLGAQRYARDAAEEKVACQRQALQQAEWNFERLRGDIEELIEKQRNGAVRLKKMATALPNPRPDIPESVRLAGLEVLQSKQQTIQRQIKALEPVNMLALEELQTLEQRLSELNNRLDILSNEREELLLRIDTAATLRRDAFMEAFNAVNSHFGEIFASLSEGDGYLQLENANEPLAGGLTLVAHPKGKAVRRLASMSGGEKSLTALSFLFALQRFRPSPFYGLDEVDSFLDGVNVERLATLIAHQAENAQFMVVSHRYPMIKAAERIIGVTQARGAHTQVVGLPDAT